MSIYNKLSELGIELPPVSLPAAAYVPFVQTGKLVFLSGHIAKKDCYRFTRDFACGCRRPQQNTSYCESHEFGQFHFRFC
ncbi:MAG: hypothetical protein RL420_915 [Pseudomonadota bacterium]